MVLSNLSQDTKIWKWTDKKPKVPAINIPLVMSTLGGVAGGWDFGFIWHNKIYIIFFFFYPHHIFTLKNTMDFIYLFFNKTFIIALHSTYN